jgi:hypothetical protein
METDDYLEHALQLAASNHQNKVAVAQAWQDALMASLEDEENPGILVNTLSKILDERNSYRSTKKNRVKPIKLSNPDKLASDYALLSGDSVTIKYMGENSDSYNYLYKVRTKPTNAGEMRIMKKKKYGCVYVEFDYQNGGRDGRRYEMDEFSDFQKFMGLITDVIYKF